MTASGPAEALWRAVTYLSVAQVHLIDNVLLSEPLTPDHVKAKPAGHWGTVPGTALALCHAVLADVPGHVVPVIGPGHAGVVQLSLGWLTGALPSERPQFTRDLDGLRELARSFPHVAGLGSEVTPALPYGCYVGGQLGPALAFAHGLALDDPDITVVPIIGDGECETPVAAAAWLGGRALQDRCQVLPVVHLNGQRMGGPSLLSTLSGEELNAYFRGLGWTPQVITITGDSRAGHERFAAAMLAGLARTADGHRTVLVLRCAKGWGGPSSDQVHKTPLRNPRGNPAELAALATWLASYRPGELFTCRGSPQPPLAAALARIRRHPRRPSLPPVPSRPRHRPRTFPAAVAPVLKTHAAAGGFRIFSPDELASNQLAVLAGNPATIELLAEEVCLAMLEGWIASNRRGLLVSYEAFASLLATGMIQHLKARRAGLRGPSLNLLLTSYGWHNSYTHADPSLATVALAAGDPAVRVLTPADPLRTAVTLTNILGSDDQVNILITGKHRALSHRTDTVEEEQRRGLAIWPHLSDGDVPGLVLAGAGDLAAAALITAMPRLRADLGLRLRYVHVHDLTTLGDPAVFPLGLTENDREHYFGPAPVLIATLGQPAAIWGLVGGRWHQPLDVLGWRETPGPSRQEELLTIAGLDENGVLTAAKSLLQRRA